MPLPYATIDAITDAVYMPDIVQNWHDEDVFAHMLYVDGPKMQGGERIKQPLAYQFTKGGWYAEYGTFDTDAEEHLTAAYLNWKQLEVPLVMSRLDQLRNDTPEAIHSYMEALVMGSKERLAQLIAQAIFSANNDSSLAINGLDHALDDSAGVVSGDTTYAGIDKATYTWWGGNTYDLGGAGVGFVYDLVNRALSTAYDGSNFPNLVACGVDSYHSYLQHAGQNSGIQRLQNTDLARRGFIGATVNGATIIADRYITDYNAAAGTPDSNRAYGINTKYIKLITHRDENFTRDPWQKPTDQNVIVSHIYAAMGLMVSRPSRHVLMYGWDSDDITAT